jgi:hypothetical protein
MFNLFDLLNLLLPAEGANFGPKGLIAARGVLKMFNFVFKEQRRAA